MTVDNPVAPAVPEAVVIRASMTLDFALRRDDGFATADRVVRSQFRTNRARRREARIARHARRGDGRASLARPRRADRGARRRDHEPQLQGRARRRRVRPQDRRQGHGAARDRPARRARGLTRRSRSRCRAGGGRVRRAGGLPRHAVPRRRRRRGGGDPRAGGAPPGRALAPGSARRPTDPRALRLIPRRRGLRRHGGDARDRRAGRVRARTRDRESNRACPRACPRAAVPQRPAHGELHRRRLPDPDRRLGVRRHGRRLLRPRELRGQQRARAGGEQRPSCRRTSARCARRTSAGSR